MTYIEHIADCLRTIIGYVEDISQIDFMANQMVQDATIRQFEVLGEATKRISTLLRDKYPEIPWKQMAGFRDRLIHDYLKVDLDLVWNTAKYSSIDLLIEIERIMNDWNTEL